MEQNLVIYIGTYKALSLMGAVVLGAWYAARKLTRVETKLDTFEPRLTNLEGRVDKLFEGQSPIALLPKGEKILEDCGLKQWINDRKDELLRRCRFIDPLANPYDIQDEAFALFEQMDFGSKLDKTLKTVAYQNGVSMESVRRIGGIYFRDICLNSVGFDPRDLD